MTVRRGVDANSGELRFSGTVQAPVPRLGQGAVAVLGLTDGTGDQASTRNREGALQWFGQEHRFMACTVYAVQEVVGAVRVANSDAGMRVSSRGQEGNGFVEKSSVTLWFLRFADI